MKKLYFALLLLILFGISSCREDNSRFVPKENSQPSSSSYCPVTKGIQRYYLVTGDLGTSKYKETMTGVTAVFDNKTYHEGLVVMDGQTQSSKVYYSEINNTYSARSTSLVYDVLIDMEYLNDKEGVGFSWTKQITPTGEINGVPARIIGTIKEKDITKVVQGKTYNNVIHSSVELQYKFFSDFEKSATYEMYAAKGVGLILTESNIDTFGMIFNSKTEMLSFTN